MNAHALDWNLRRGAHLWLASVALIVAVFGGWVALELFLGPSLPVEAAERLHLARGVSTALFIALVLVFWAERKVRRMERDVEEQKRHLAEVLRSATDAIVGIDDEEKIVYWNRGAELVYGYRPDEILGKPLRQILPKSRRDGKAGLPKLSPTEPIGEFLTERLGKDGRRVSVLVRRVGVNDGERECMGCSAVENQLQSLRALETQLTHSEQLAMVGEMAAGLAHEIKNPLAGIAGAIQVLGETLPSGDERQPVVAKVLEQVRRIDGTVRDLLTYARPKDALLERTDLHQVIENALGVVGFLPSEHLKIVRRFHKDVPPALIDAEQFGQVLSNLFINAVQAMPGGGTLTIETAASRKGIRISVKDSGPGIAAEHLDRIFDPFFTTKTRGTGLGLPICRRVVEAHGGTIEVRSRPGQGAEFVIHLPSGSDLELSGSSSSVTKNPSIQDLTP